MAAPIGKTSAEQPGPNTDPTAFNFKEVVGRGQENSAKARERAKANQIGPKLEESTGMFKASPQAQETMVASQAADGETNK